MTRFVEPTPEDFEIAKRAARFSGSKKEFRDMQEHDIRDARIMDSRVRLARCNKGKQ